MGTDNVLPRRDMLRYARNHLREQVRSLVWCIKFGNYSAGVAL
jgi:hypothetical protein